MHSVRAFGVASTSMSLSYMSGLETLEDLVIVPPKFGLGKMVDIGVRGDKSTTPVSPTISFTVRAAADSLISTVLSNKSFVSSYFSSRSESLSVSMVELTSDPGSSLHKSTIITHVDNN